ncbi:hypothetical protein [Ferrimonas sp. YFM]|uniref:hypothetical protein n=1 Tax=Ferrimonas sp. YFM TaxID=3028878 RepID=UPI002572247E|nr:hypothetical protein [Ferrimonas sp. YFM]
MSHRVVAKALVPCDCNNEGMIRVDLLEHGVTLDCYYLGSEEQIGQAFPLEQERRARLTLWHGEVVPTEARERSLDKAITGVYLGARLNSDGDVEYLIDSLIPVKTDNELGDFQIPAAEGDWVQCRGQWVIDLCDY